jgi:hypothetical protein
LERGIDVRRWRVEDSERWLIYTYPGIDISRYGAVLEHLKPWQQQLEARAVVQQKNWYELQQAQFLYVRAFTEPKIVFPDIAKASRFALDRAGAFPSNTVYLVPSEDLYLLGVLNSRPVEKFFVQLGAVIRGGYLRFFRQYVERIPIPQAGPGDRKSIESLVLQCIHAANEQRTVAELEAEIDARVAHLYGLETDAGSLVAPAAAEVGG